MQNIGRRDFLKSATTAAVVPGGLAVAAAGDADMAAIPIRTFGTTSLRLPVLAYGGAALPTKMGSPLSWGDRIELVRYAYERGVRYFDTANNYLESQKILGEALKDVRDHVCYVSKVETSDPQQVRAQVERSMRELQTDHLDAVLIHGTPGLQQMSVSQAFEVHAELIKLKSEKITSFIGLSAHGYFDKALALIESGGFDLYMPAYGYIPRGHDQVFSPRMQKLREASIAKAHELKMGIAAMKVVGAGMLGGWASHIVPRYDKEKIRQMPGAAIRWALNDKRIDLLVIGMRLKSDIDANIKTLTNPTEYTPQDDRLLTDFCVLAHESEAMKKLKLE